MLHKTYFWRNEKKTGCFFHGLCIFELMKRITIKDLARLLDMSPSTISRALSDHPDISDSTKKRVIQLAKELNYTKNIHARFFRKQNSGLVALILPEINMFFTPSLIQEIN
ncbi:MAG: LacI family DNA-binding transcriptional regulator, partial [Salibacteraceae bacterium]